MTYVRDFTAKLDSSHLSVGRLKVSEPHTLLSLTQTYDKNDYEYADSLTGTGTYTYDINTSSSLFSCPVIGDKVIRQSKRYIFYQPGKALEINLTGILNAPLGKAKAGFFDANNGLFFMSNSNGMNIVLRTKTSGSVVDTIINQSEWNRDKLDGTGNSSLTADWTKTHIFSIELAWLGVGSVRFSILDAGDTGTVVHEINNFNQLTNVYMTTAILPIRYEAESTDGAVSLKQICASVISDGGFETIGRQFCVRQTSYRSIVTELPMISFRIKTSGSGYINPRIRVEFSGLTVTAIAGKSYYVEVWYLPYTTTPLTGASWVDVNSKSGVQYDVSATALNTANGILINTFYVADILDIEKSLNIKLTPFSTNIDGTASDYMVFNLVKTEATNISAYMGVNFVEHC